MSCREAWSALYTRSTIYERGEDAAIGQGSIGEESRIIKLYLAQRTG